jgi:hypothetical protein
LAYWYIRDRYQVRAPVGWAVHAEGINLSKIRVTQWPAPVSAARTEVDRTVTVHARLALHPNEVAGAFVQDEVIAVVSSPRQKDCLACRD